LLLRAVGAKTPRQDSPPRVLSDLDEPDRRMSASAENSGGTEAAASTSD
jgi:hypothetical protein